MHRLRLLVAWGVSLVIVGTAITQAETKSPARSSSAELLPQGTITPAATETPMVYLLEVWSDGRAQFKTLTPTPYPTFTPIFSDTPSPTPSATPSSTPTPVVTLEPTQENTPPPPLPTPTHTPWFTPEPTKVCRLKNGEWNINTRTDHSVDAPKVEGALWEARDTATFSQFYPAEGYLWGYHDDQGWSVVAIYDPESGYVSWWAYSIQTDSLFCTDVEGWPDGL